MDGRSTQGKDDDRATQFFYSAAADPRDPLLRDHPFWMCAWSGIGRRIASSVCRRPVRKYLPRGWTIIRNNSINGMNRNCHSLFRNIRLICKSVYSNRMNDDDVRRQESWGRTERLVHKISIIVEHTSAAGPRKSNTHCCCCACGKYNTITFL